MAVNPWVTVLLRSPLQRSHEIRSGRVPFGFGNATAAFGRRCIVLAILLAAIPAAALAQSGTLTVNNASPVAGTAVTFTANVFATFAPPPTTLSFGDATSVALAPPYPVSVSHIYTTPGKYTATLSDTSGTLATVGITVLVPAPRVPQGAIYSSVPIASTVLAGDDTSIVVNYRVVTPALGTPVSSSSPLEAVIELLDAKDRFISRGDPVFVPYSAFAGGGIVSAQIPFTVPSDARGLYHVRVYLREREIGGTVAVGQPFALVVVGGPDPAPVVSSEFHVNGSIEVGPRIGAGGTGGTIPNSEASGDLNANLKLALQQPTYTFSAATALNPTSRRVDPLLTLVPGSGNLDSPNSQQPAPQSSSAPLHYEHTAGPVTAQLPPLLFSGGESLRGLNSVVNTAGWTFHEGWGFPHLATATSGLQVGDLFDVTRSFSANQSLRATFIHNIDDKNTFVPSGGSAPIDAEQGGLEFDQAFNPHVALKLGAALSMANDETGTQMHTSDRADKGEFTYNLGTTLLDLEYHNFGPRFATINGVAAASDSAGGSAQANFGLTPISTLAIHFARDDRRSAVSRDGQENALFTLAPPNGMQFTLGAGRDHTLTISADTTSRQLNFNLGRSAGAATVNLGGNVASVSDAKNASSDGVTRTGTFQFSLARGASNISLGLNATANQVATPSSTVGESLVVAFPIGLHASAGGGATSGQGGSRAFSASRGLEVQLSGSNGNSKAATAATRDLNFGATLAYHLGPHLSLGVHGLTAHHTDFVNPANTSTNSSLRVRLDVQI